MQIKQHFPSKKAIKTKGQKVVTSKSARISINDVIASISASSPITKDEKEAAEDSRRELIETFKYILPRLYLLGAGIGDTTRPFNTYKGYIGRLIWILNILIHFSLDFYEAKYVFHISWATSIGIYMCAFVFGTIYTIKSSIPCYVHIMSKLVKDGRYHTTFAKMKKIFRVSLVHIAFEVSGTHWQ